VEGKKYLVGDIDTASVVSIFPMIGVGFLSYPNISSWPGFTNSKFVWKFDEKEGYIRTCFE
jgi:hypothetical protein